MKFIVSYVKKRLPLWLRFIEPKISDEDRRFVDPEYVIRHMNKFGINMMALTHSSYSTWETLSENEALILTKVLNDAMAAIPHEYPDRFVAVATLPSLTGESLDELDRCISQLGMKGVLIFTSVNGKPLDSPEFMPFYDKMAKYDLPIWIHPMRWPYYQWFGYKYDMTHVFGYPFETAIAAARLVYGGVLENHPNLKFILHHLGGMIPLVASRIKEFYEESTHDPLIMVEKYGDMGLSKEPIEYFKMMYADTVVCGSKEVIDCGLAFYSPEHIVFGTDYPFGPEKGEKWTRDILALVKDLPKEEQQKILEDNARILLKIR